jgi:hypothetical protein
MNTFSTEDITSAFLTSPQQVITPIWVSASGISPEARALAEPLIAGAMTVHGDEAPVLDRQMLAWWINLPRHDKGLTKYLDELQSIGFLVIFGGRTDKSGRRQARFDSATGRTIPDTFAVRMDPPPNYVGPRSLAEAREVFLSDRDAAYSQVPAGRRKDKAGIKRTQVGHLDVSPGQHLPPKTGGRVESPAPQIGGQVDVSPGQHLPPKTGGTSKEEIGDLSGRREISDLSMERDAASLRKAGDAALEDDELTAEVRQLVNRLPWETTSKGRNAKVMTDANTTLVPAIAAAIRNGWLTLAQAQDHALRKIAAAGVNPVVYVANGFAADLIPLPTPDDVLPLPDLQAVVKAADSAADGQKGASGAPGVGGVGVTPESGAEPVKPETWCGDCAPERGQHGGPVCARSCENRTSRAS